MGWGYKYIEYNSKFNIKTFVNAWGVCYHFSQPPLPYLISKHPEYFILRGHK